MKKYKCTNCGATEKEEDIEVYDELGYPLCNNCLDGVLIEKEEEC